MKKYNLSEIMKRAWELVKKAGMTISSGLKKAWEEAKTAENKITYKMIENAAKKYIDEHFPTNGYFTSNRWQKYGKDRIYFNICRRNHKYNKSAGYWDMKEDTYVAPAHKGIDLSELI